ncbi:hypothetical protein [Mesoplasma lactucae]|uniref:Uncharacterized protein n=1 Tax=Mesoplasma lactucae ATCC 49193 TaxID=81460 RepID=A0A291IRP6_9MOLU|nr:hypothetical protein [Mesoplasma lactucae]ATG97424.1 hypothetical protein CP520_01455 [Mesoplasma lactucae ATCC 49193]ATZ20123.1 hypothetical protein MLACT_v1c03020 [Mesoplasma lactucae ATCC 49193]MCL8216871.1 hypothetical protein [Mesoplasma lactucae ATCC 49193]
MKINKKYFWAIGAILLFGVFAIIAFEAVGFRMKDTLTSINGTITQSITIKLNDFEKGTNYSEIQDIYGLAVAGLVFAWVGVLIPLFGLLYQKEAKYTAIIFWTTLFVEVLAMVLMIASVAVYDADFKSLLKTLEDLYTTDDYNETVSINKGAVAGQFILIIVGGLIADAGIIAARNNLTIKVKETVIKAN